MIVWSERPDPSDLTNAARAVNEEFPGANVFLRSEDGDLRLISKALSPRIRSRRILHVHLRTTNSSYYPNTGTNGAAVHEYAMAASWTEWGWFLARVFEMDPKARCGQYHSIDDFHKQTGGRFRDPRTPRQRQLVRELERVT